MNRTGSFTVLYVLAANMEEHVRIIAVPVHQKGRE